MFKKFCDRCDREITKEDNVRSITICKKLPNPTDSGKVYGKPIHLCEDCANAFYDWMKSYSPIQQIVEEVRKETGLEKDTDIFKAPKETESGAIVMSPDNTEDSLWEMELSARAHNALVLHGCKSVDDVCKHTEEELLGFRRIGKRTLAEIIDKLAERGRHLREEAV